MPRPEIIGSRRSGFTLIEILVVVVIIGILSAVIAISVGVLGRDRDAEDQAKRLWAVMTQVKEESELLGRNVGVLVDRTGYEFVQFDARRWSWVQIVDDDLLAPRQLPPGLSIRLVLEGREVVLKPHSERVPKEESSEQSGESSATANPLDKKDDSKKTLQDAEMAPQIMMLASGDVNSFDMSLEREGAETYHWHVFSKPDNSIELEDTGTSDAAR